MSSPSPWHRLATQHFDEHYKSKQSESFLSQPEPTIWVSRHKTLRIHIYIWVFFFESSIWILQVTKTFASRKVFVYILLYSHSLSFQAPTNWNFHLHKRLLPDGVSVVIVFPFLGGGFGNIPLTFLIPCEVQTRYSKTFKYSEQYIHQYILNRPFIRYQGKNLDLIWIWWCFNFSLALPRAT